MRGQTVSETVLADPQDALDFAAWDLMAERGLDEVNVANSQQSPLRLDPKRPI